MSDKTVVALLAVTLLATAVPAPSAGDVRRETTERRPYIIEIGEPYSITAHAIQREAANISGLREYISDYGYPDYAEVQEIAPEWPWESYEVRLYYLRRNLETDFGHVFLSSAMPNYGVLKFQGDITPEKRHEIEVILQSRQAPPPAPSVPVAAEAPPPPAAAEQTEPTGLLSEALVARIEAAADRAAVAADRAAEQSEAATRAADRTVSIVEKMVETVGPASRHGSH